MVKDRGNLITYYRKLSTQSIEQQQQQKTKQKTTPHQNSKFYKNKIHICDVSEFEPLLDPFSKKKNSKQFYRPSITHRDEHVAKIYIKIGRKFKKFALYTPF